MKLTHKILLFSLLIGDCAVAATPEKPIAEKGTLVFSDDFKHSDLGEKWKIGIPAFTVTGPALKGSQARDDHGAAIGATLKLPDGNAILELKFRFDGANSINVSLDDKSFAGVHAGHISRVVIKPNRITLLDDKEGVMRYPSPTRASLEFAVATPTLRIGKKLGGPLMDQQQVQPQAGAVLTEVVVSRLSTEQRCRVRIYQQVAIGFRAPKSSSLTDHFSAVQPRRPGHGRRH